MVFNFIPAGVYGASDFRCGARRTQEDDDSSREALVRLAFDCGGGCDMVDE